MKKLLMSTCAVLALAGSAHAELFQVPTDVSAGHMNVRNGPGANHGLLGAIPAGQMVQSSRCVPRDDGVTGANWCFVTWGNLRGWVSQAGLMPVAVPPETEIRVDNQNVQNDKTGVLFCGAPKVNIGDEPDPNPVVNMEVRYSSKDHAWRIFHHRMNGEVVSRSEQYSIVDASDDNKAQWKGSLNRNRSIYMIGEAKRNKAGVPVYVEWMYDRAKNNRLVMEMEATCRMVKNNEGDVVMEQPSR